MYPCDQILINISLYFFYDPVSFFLLLVVFISCICSKRYKYNDHYKTKYKELIFPFQFPLSFLEKLKGHVSIAYKLNFLVSQIFVFGKIPGNALLSIAPPLPSKIITPMLRPAQAASVTPDLINSNFELVLDASNSRSLMSSSLSL